MANLQKTVEIIFGGKNEVSKTIGDIEKSFGTLDSAVSKITAPLASVADSILKVDAALLAMAIGGLALAVKEAGNFNGKFGEITTLISDTGAPIEAFKTAIKNYATDSVKSITDINQAIYTAVSAGVDYKKSIEFVTTAEKLSVAGRSELGDTTKVLISVLNAYGQGTDQAGKYSDIMFTTVKLGLTTMTELSSTLAQVTGLAANAGIPFATLSAAIAALTTTGMPTAQAITSIKAAIQNIIKPVGEAETTAKALGLQFNATALKTKGFEGVLWDAQKATGGNVEKMAQLFGSVEALNAVMILAADKTGKFKSSLEEISKSAGATQVAYDKVANEFGNINQRLENSFKITLGNIGEKIMPEYGKITGALGDLMKGIKVGVDAGAFDDLFDYLKSVGASLAEWIKGVAAAFPDALKNVNFDKLIEAFNKLGEALGGYFDGMDLTKSDDLGSALQTLVDIITGLVNVTTGMAEAFKPFITQIVNFFKELANGEPEAQKTMGTVLAFGAAIEKGGLLVVAAILAIDKYGLSMKGMFDVVGGGTTVLWNSLQILFQFITEGFLAVELALVEFLDQMTFGTFPGLTGLKTTITDQMAAVSKSITTNGEEASAGLSKMAEGFLQLGSDAVTGQTKVKALATGLAELPSETITTVKAFCDEANLAIASKALEKAVPSKKDVDIVIWGTEALAKAVPEKKTMEVEAKIDMEKIKAQSDIIQKSMEWKAKVDIANIEAAAATIKVIFSNLDTRITSTATVIGTILGSLTNADLSSSVKYKLAEMLRDEAAARKVALEQSAKLTEQQIELNKLKLSSLERGDSMIKISADGLKPQLEMILWEILEAIQVRANASGAEFLLGVT